MFDSSLLNILCCPVTRQSLFLADENCLTMLNAAAAAGKLQNVAGEKITEPLVEALVTEDKSRVYLIREGIPVLLADEAISLPLGG